MSCSQLWTRDGYEIEAAASNNEEFSFFDGLKGYVYFAFDPRVTAYCMDEHDMVKE